MFILLVLATVSTAYITLRDQIIDGQIRESLTSQQLASQLALEYINTSEITLQTVLAGLERQRLIAPLISETVGKNSANAQAELDQLLIDTIRVDSRLIKLRIINDQGLEVSRVDRVGSDITASPTDQLQDKSARSYVRDALFAGPGALLASPISLNEEYGEVTEPRTPVVRFTLTVAIEGKVWVLVSSARFQDYVEALSRAINTAIVDDVWMARPDGVFIIGGNRFRQFTFADQTDMEGSNLQTLLPSMWRATSEERRGALISGDLLRVFSRVGLPILNVEGSKQGIRREPVVVYELSVNNILARSGFSTPVFYAMGASALLALIALGGAVFSALRSREQLAQEKIKQDKIFSVVAHELRTPASAIDMMIRGEALNEVDQDDLEAASTHLLNVIDDLRQVLHPTDNVEFQKQPFSFGSLKTEIDRQMAPLCSANNMTLHSDIPESAYAVYVGDAYRLRVVITNLIRNAVTHSGGKSVWLSIAHEALSPTSDRVTIVVEDDGDGINPRFVPDMFDPFSKAGSDAASTGVGLAIVKQWTERMGGEVHYGIGERGGARFSIIIPFDRGFSEARVAMAPNSAVMDALNQSTVLFVEDDRILRSLTLKKLEHYGCEIISAADGEEALEIFAERRVQLLITDYFMPKISGKQLIEKIRETDQALPCIAFTAASVGSEADDLRQAGADAVLAKPFASEKFEAAIARLIVEGRFGGSGSVIR